MSAEPTPPLGEEGEPLPTWAVSRLKGVAIGVVGLVGSLLAHERPWVVVLLATLTVAAIVGVELTRIRNALRGRPRATVVPPLPNHPRDEPADEIVPVEDQQGS